ncbi:MAG TPA: copper resistance protein B [Moraxellaceae bacterium]
MSRLAIAFSTALLAIPVHAEEDHSHHGHHMAMPEPAPVQPQESATASLPPPTAEEMAAAFPDLGGMQMQDHMAATRYTKLMVDRLEWQDADVHDAAVWDARLSWGGDFNRLWLSSEGEREGGATGHLKSQLYVSHAFSRWWEATAGLRQDGGEGPGRTWAGVGIQGLAPYFFELSAMAYAGEGGRTALEFEAEYELLLSNRLILQPRLELNAYGKDDVEKGTGSGLSDAEFGLRLRYEIRREFAPYAGVEWSRKFGDSADLARDSGARTGEARAVAGVRLWW